MRLNGTLHWTVLPGNKTSMIEWNPVMTVLPRNKSSMIEWNPVMDSVIMKKVINN